MVHISLISTTMSQLITAVHMPLLSPLVSPKVHSSAHSFSSSTCYPLDTLYTNIHFTSIATLTICNYIAPPYPLPQPFSPLSPIVWLTSNFLKLNSYKIEFLLTGPKSLLSFVQNISLIIDVHTVTPSPIV